MNRKHTSAAAFALAIVLFAPHFNHDAIAAEAADEPATAASAAVVAQSIRTPEGVPMPGYGKMRGGMMPGMMPGGMMPYCPGMMGMGMGMGGMMRDDPKFRAEMMQIRGRMMKEVGELLERRGKELEAGKP